MKELDGLIFPSLGDITGFPNIDKDAVKAKSELGVVEFQQLGRQIVWPRRLPIRHTADYPRNLVDSGFTSRR